VKIRLISETTVRASGGCVDSYLTAITEVSGSTSTLSFFRKSSTDMLRRWRRITVRATRSLSSRLVIVRVTPLVASCGGRSVLARVPTTRVVDAR
jgi:hypothetical protein